MEEDGCPPPYRVIDVFTMGTRCNDPSRCSRFVVPFFVNETDVWATYVYDVEDKVAYMVDPTLTEARTTDELHTEDAKNILEGIHYCLWNILKKPKWDVDASWEYRGADHGPKQFALLECAYAMWHMRSGGVKRHTNKALLGFTKVPRIHAHQDGLQCAA